DWSSDVCSSDLGILQLSGRGFGIGAAQRATGRITISSGFSVVALGAVYGLAGFCAGRLLGSVLAMSATAGDPISGGLFLAIFALGMAAPLFLIALLWERFELGKRSWLRGRGLAFGRFRVHTTNMVSGLLFVGLGVLFIVTEGTANLGGIASVDLQYSLSTWLCRVTSNVPNLLVILVLALIALGIAGWQLRKTRKKSESST